MFDTHRLRRWLLAAALLWMPISNLAILWSMRAEMLRGYGDFSTFYTAGTLVRRGLGAELYSPSAQWKVQQEFASEVKIRRAPLLYMRPPFEALLFSAFTAWPYATALAIWTGFKLVLLAALPFVMVRRRFWREYFPLWATIVLILGTFPELMDLLMGQDAPLLALLFAISYRQLASGSDRSAGFALGLALFKFQLVIPFAAMLWMSGRKRILPGFAASAFVVVAISAVIVGGKGLLAYPGYLLAMSQATGVGIAIASQVNLRALLTWSVGHALQMRIDWVLIPVTVGAIVYSGLIWRKAGDRFLAEGFGLASIVAIITSYYASDYDLLMLVVPLLAMHTRRDAPKADRLTRYLETTGLLLLLLTPVYWFTRVYLQAECLMTLPLLALGIALARRLTRVRLEAGTERSTSMPVMDALG